MRKAMFPVVSLLLAACGRIGGPSEAPDTLLYRSTFEGSTNGLVLHESGDVGHAGMFGTNCPFETITGSVTGDYDLPGEGEDVQDGESTTLGEITLVATIPDTIHVLDKTDGVYTHVEIPVDGVAEGRLTRDGVVAMDLGCTMRWIGFDRVEHGTVVLDQCGGELEVDPDSGTTAVSDPGGVVIVDGTEVVPTGLGADLVAFDDTLRVFYAAQTGQPRLSAIGRDGSVRWTVDTPGPVTALDDAGAAAQAVVVVSLPSGKGGVVFYDGATGAQVHFAETPSTADDLSVSGNGQIVALVRPEQTFFYGLLE